MLLSSRNDTRLCCTLFRGYSKILTRGLFCPTHRVRISGGGGPSGSGGDGDTNSAELSVEASDFSTASLASIASLSAYAPGGVRPPSLQDTAISVAYKGTMSGNKRVSWAEYAEEYEFEPHGGSGSDDERDSVVSMTEEELLEAQGLMGTR